MEEIFNQATKLFLSHRNQTDWFNGLVLASCITLENLQDSWSGENGLCELYLLWVTLGFQLFSSLFSPSLSLSPCTLYSYDHLEEKKIEESAYQMFET